MEWSGVVWGYWGYARFIEVGGGWQVLAFWERSGNAGVSGEKCGLCGPGMRDGCCDEEGGGPGAAVDIAGVGNGIEAFLDRFNCRQWD